MNRYQRLIAGAWVLAGLTAVASIGAWVDAAPRAPSSPPDHPSLRSWQALSAMRRGGTQATAEAANLRASAAALRDRNPFRMDRKPTSVRFNPFEPVAIPGTAVVTAKPRPNLALVGLVGGPPWTALIEGIPGREGGVVLRVGQEVGGIRLSDARSDTVWLAGFDTTWVLSTRRLWR